MTALIKCSDAFMEARIDEEVVVMDLASGARPNASTQQEPTAALRGHWRRGGYLRRSRKTAPTAHMVSTGGSSSGGAAPSYVKRSRS